MTDSDAETRAKFPPTVHAYTDVLKVLAVEPGHGIEDLAEITGRVKSTPRRDWPKLVDADIVVRDLAADGESWRLTERGQRWVAGMDVAEGRAGLSRDEDPANLSLRHADILPDPDNARRDWTSDDAVADLAALANDIRDNGLLQNLIVRPHPDPLVDEFILVGGERRWRALGLLIERGEWLAEQTVPARRLSADDVGIRLAALAENLQRRALNPIEEAAAYRGLRDVGLTTEQIADKVSMTQRHVQGRLQLLEVLTEDQQRRMTLPADDKGRLSVSEARQLVAHAEAKTKRREKAEADLSPRARLVFAEVRLANPGWYVQVPVDGVAINADPDAIALHQAGYLDLPTSYDLDGTANAQIEHAGFDLITTLFGDTGLESNAAYAARLRAELNLPAPEEGRFSTPWLNGPFEVPAEAKADIEARIAAREAEEEARETRQREEAEARQATRDAQAQVAAEARTLFDARRQTSQGVPVEDLMAIAGRADAPLPWRMNSENAVLAADGNLIIGAGPSDRSAARMRLLVLGVNAAAGLDTPEDEAPEPEQAADGSDPDADDEGDTDEDEGDDE